ncbi:MAG: BACON domain-containing protein [Candidatus Aminicenantales bacterium]
MGDRFSTRRTWLPILIAAGFVLVQTTGLTQDRAGKAGPPELTKAPISRPDVRGDDEGLRRLGAELKHFRTIGDLASAAKVFAQMFPPDAVPDPAAALKIGASARSNRVEGTPGNIKDTGLSERTIPVFFSPEDEVNPAAETWNSNQGDWALFSAAEQWAGGQPSDIRIRKSFDRGLTWTETMVVGDGQPWTQPSLRQVSDQALGMAFVREWDGGDGDVFFARLSEDLTTDAEFPVTLGQADQRNPSLATDFRSYGAPYLFVVYAESEGLTRSVKFSVSPDAGVTWTQPLTIGSFSSPDGPDVETAIAYDPDRNTLHVAFCWPQGQASGIAVVSSTTFGASWSRPVFITPEDTMFDSSPKIAAKKGTVLVVYEHRTSDGRADIGLSGSSDSGISWTSGGSLAATAAVERFPDIRVADGTGAPKFFASYVEAGTQVHVLSRDGVGPGTWTTEWTSETDGGLIESGPVVVTPLPASDGNSSAGVFWAGGNPDSDIRFGSVRLLSLADIIVTPPNRDVPYTSDTTTFAVDTTGPGHVDWTAAVISGGSWLDIQSGSSGRDAGTIVAEYDGNTTADTRGGSIQVTPADITSPPVTVTVTQAGEAALEVTPADGLLSTGPEGGPFVPASMDYTLRNSGGSAVSWTAAEGRPWLTLFPASGDLEPGASTTVTVSFAAAANNLNTGTYNATVTFTNRTNGIGDTTRPVRLTVIGPAGSLSVSPTGGLVATGFVGGPFAPSGQTYTLLNDGSTSIDWTAVKVESWTTLSAESGTLDAGASTTVTVSINAAADVLAAGIYHDTVTFTNTTNGNGNASRAVTLTISTPPGALTVTPAGGLSSSGPEGGPFSPPSQIYTLRNSGASTLSWTASRTRTWISLSAASGTLAAGDSTTVTVSINGSANSLVVGEYNDTITLTNTTNGNGNTSRPVALSVELGPALSVTPINRDVPFTEGTTTFDVANTGVGTMSWTAAVISGGSWLSIQSGGSGTNAGTITVAFASNRTSTPRAGTIRVTAAEASGSPRDVTVSQNEGSLALAISGQRLIEKAWIIQRAYARLTVTFDNPAAVPVETFRVYRRSGAGAEEIVQQVDGASVTTSPFVVNDAFLEEGTSYTYRVVAVDVFGNVIAQSNEITI